MLSHQSIQLQQASLYLKIIHIQIQNGHIFVYSYTYIILSLDFEFSFKLNISVEFLSLNLVDFFFRDFDFLTGVAFEDSDRTHRKSPDCAKHLS